MRDLIPQIKTKSSIHPMWTAATTCKKSCSNTNPSFSKLLTLMSPTQLICTTESLFPTWDVMIQTGDYTIGTVRKNTNSWLKIQRMDLSYNIPTWLGNQEIKIKQNKREKVTSPIFFFIVSSSLAGVTCEYSSKKSRKILSISWTEYFK